MKRSNIMNNIAVILTVLAALVIVVFLIWGFWGLINAPTIETTYYSYNGKFLRCQKITPSGINSQTKTICTDH